VLESDHTMGAVSTARDTTPSRFDGASRPRELSDQEFRALVDTLDEKEPEYLRGYVQGIRRSKPWSRADESVQ